MAFSNPHQRILVVVSQKQCESRGKIPRKSENRIQVVTKINKTFRHAKPQIKAYIYRSSAGLFFNARIAKLAEKPCFFFHISESREDWVHEADAPGYWKTRHPRDNRIVTNVIKTIPNSDVKGSNMKCNSCTDMESKNYSADTQVQIELAGGRTQWNKRSSNQVSNTKKEGTPKEGEEGRNGDTRTNTTGPI